MTTLRTIAPRLRQLVLLLSSSHPGEVQNAAAAIGRALKAVGADWHAFAEAIEPTIPETEMRRLYDAGYGDGVQAAENKHHNGDDFINTDGSPSWHQVARYCQHHIDKLDERHHRFVNDMAGRTVYELLRTNRETTQIPFAPVLQAWRQTAIKVLPLRQQKRAARYAAEPAQGPSP
jgi:hypothetical protein